MSPNPAVLTWPRAVAGGGPSYAFISAIADSANSTTHTYSGVSLGTAAANRTVIVALSTRGTAGANATAVTIAGVTATKAGDVIAGVASVSIWTASVPTGATGTIVVTSATKGEGRYGGVWAAYGTLTYSTSGTSTAGGHSITLTAPENCLAIAAQAAAGTIAASYSGATERYRTSAYVSRAGADAQPAAGSHTISTPGSGGSNVAAVVVDFTLT